MAPFTNPGRNRYSAGTLSCADLIVSHVKQFLLPYKIDDIVFPRMVLYLDADALAG
jgi:hypothetical protein